MARGRSTFARIAAPAAFLLAATVLVLLVRSAIDSPQPAGNVGPGPAATAPAETDATPPQTVPARTEPVETGEGEEEGTFHTIVAGDTLESIASQYGTSVERLLELNPGVDPVALTVGQRIRVA